MNVKLDPNASTGGFTANEFFQFAAIAMAAELAARTPDTAVEEACKTALKGITPDEPGLQECLADISLHGFHLHKKVAWGLVYNCDRSQVELARLF